MKDILAFIISLREARGWTEYQLAENSGLPQSTISSWYRKGMVPTVPSLLKICAAFDITLAQLFSEDEQTYDLTENQQHLLRCWARLDSKQQDTLIAFLESFNNNNSL